MSLVMLLLKTFTFAGCGDSSDLFLLHLFSSVRFDLFSVNISRHGPIHLKAGRRLTKEIPTLHRTGRQQCILDNTTPNPGWLQQLGQNFSKFFPPTFLMVF